MCGGGSGGGDGGVWEEGGGIKFKCANKLICGSPPRENVTACQKKSLRSANLSIIFTGPIGLPEPHIYFFWP